MPEERIRVMEDTLKSFEGTIRNLDGSVKSLSLQMERYKLDDYKNLMEVLNPLFEKIRTVEKNCNVAISSTKEDLSAFKTEAEKEHHKIGKEIKSDILKTIRNYAGVIWFAIIMISGMGKLIYDDIREDISKNTLTPTTEIIKNG